MSKIIIRIGQIAARILDESLENITFDLYVCVSYTMPYSVIGNSHVLINCY